MWIRRFFWAVLLVGTFGTHAQAARRRVAKTKPRAKPAAAAAAPRPSARPKPPARPKPRITTLFTTLDRMSRRSLVGGQFGFDKFARLDITDGFGLRGEVYGQYVFPGRTLGVYGQAAIARLVLSGTTDQNALSSVDAGGYYLMHPGRYDLVLRGGLVLPTASTGTHQSVNQAVEFERLTDFATIIPKTLWARASASMIGRRDDLFYRLDGGFDWAFSSSAGVDDLLGRLNAGVGIDTREVAVQGELVNLGNLTGSGTLSARFLHTFAVTLRVRNASNFHVAVITPLDGDVIGDVYVISFGARYVLP